MPPPNLRRHIPTPQPAPAPAAAPPTYNIRPVTTTIDGVRWMVTPLGTDDAADTLVGFFSILGPSFGAIAAAHGDEKAATLKRHAGEAIAHLTVSLATGKLMPLVRTLLHDLLKNEMEKVGEEDVIWNYEFRGGQLSKLIPIVVWALKENFGDFFGVLSALAKANPKALEAMGLSLPNGSEGSTG